MPLHDDLLAEPDQFRHAMGRFATGVTIVTSLEQGRPVGMTVNSLTSVSLRPCLLLVCLKHGSITGAAIRAHGAFGINLLAQHQKALALGFARPSDDRFSGVEFELAEHQVPILRHCAASFVCTLSAIHEAGDHEIMLGEVMRVAHAQQQEPLVLLGGEFGRYAPPPAA